MRDSSTTSRRPSPATRRLAGRLAPVALVGVLVAGVGGVLLANQASATAPPISKSQECDLATNDVIVTLGAPASWWNFEIASDTGLNISTETASSTITFTVPRSKVPTTLTIRYKDDAWYATTVVIDEPDCMTPPTTSAPTTAAPGTTVAPPTTGGPATTAPGTTVAPPATGPATTIAGSGDSGSGTRVESKTSVRKSAGATAVKAGDVNFAG